MLRQFSTFLLGSGLGATIDYLLTLVMHAWFDVPPPLGLGMAMMVSVSVVFVFHQRITFSSTTEKSLRRYLIFLVWSVLIYALRAGMLLLFVWLGIGLHIALLLAIGFASVINYLVSADRIFRR